jgi:hypothetical protein
LTRSRAFRIAYWVGGKLAWVIGFVPLWLPVVFILGNGLMLVFGPAAGFQRLGSLWIALAAVSFASARRLYAKASEAKGETDDVLEQFIKVGDFTVGIVATLQWGYGDLFHCWINGNGWKPC